MIEISQLNKEQLLHYIQSDAFKMADDIPISLHRAHSQLCNPRLSDDDIILLLAIENKRLIAYLGILPDTLFIKEKAPIKAAWLTCLWVSPHARGKGLSVQLINKASEIWKGNILLAAYVPFTKVIYDRTGHFTKEPFLKEGLRLYLKSDLQNILPQKRQIFKRITYLLKAFDFSANALLHLRDYVSKDWASTLHFEYIDHIDKEVDDFIRPMQTKELFRRNAVELNWIMQNPWILSAPEKDDLNKKFYFSSTANSFDFYALKIRNSGGELRAFMLFAKRNDTLQLPFFYHNDGLDMAVETINHLLKKWKIKTFTAYQTDLSKHLKQQKTPALFKKVTNRKYLFAKTLLKTLEKTEIVMQDGDGDCCFT